MSKNFAATLPKAKAQLEVVERDIPKPGAGELLVKNNIIGVNPVDWKVQDYAIFVTDYPAVMGTDLASEVISVGPNVTNFKPGDRVTGYAPFLESHNSDHGAFQNYTLLRAHASTKIPDSITDDQAVVLPMQVATAGDAIFRILGLPRISKTSKPLKGEGVVLWGGASSMGLGALQMLKALGFTTYVTASAHNHSYLKGLGADYTFDYKEANVADAIIKTAKEKGERVRYGFDAIGGGSPHSSVVTAKIVSQLANGPGKVVLLLGWPEGETKPENLTIDGAFAANVTKEGSDLGKWLFNEWLPASLVDGSYKPEPPTQHVGSGLQDLQKAFDTQKAGVSGKKIVVPLA